MVVATAWAARGSLRGPQGPPGLDGSGYLEGVVPAGDTDPAIAHELGTRAVEAIVWEVQPGGAWRRVPVAYEAETEAIVRLSFLAAPTVGQYRYLLLAGAPVAAQLVPVPVVDLIDASSIVTPVAAGVHFVLDAMGGPTRTLAAPGPGAARGQRVLWELTAAAACTLTLADGSGGFEATAAAPALHLDLAAGQAVVLGALWSPPRNRWLLLAMAPTL